jgi:hypothetical protein
MREGRLPLEFRDRAKGFAAKVIRLYVKLPKEREEVRVCGRQLLRAGTSVAAHVREASPHDLMRNLYQNLAEPSKKLMNPNSGLNSSANNVASSHLTLNPSKKNPMN